MGTSFHLVIMPAGKKVSLEFYETFGLSGTAAVTSKTIAAPIERIKMVVQNQDEMLKRGTLAKPFKGIMDCGRWIVADGGLSGGTCLLFVYSLAYARTRLANDLKSP